MFYTTFIALCEKKGKKPHSVLKELKIVHTNLDRWKNGSTPNVFVIYDIAKYFGIRIEDLIEREYL